MHPRLCWQRGDRRRWLPAKQCGCGGSMAAVPWYADWPGRAGVAAWRAVCKTRSGERRGDDVSKKQRRRRHGPRRSPCNPIDRTLKRMREELMPATLSTCAQACYDCAAACEQCLTAMIDTDSNNDCPHCCRECLDICLLCAQAEARGSKYLDKICKLCAEVCRWCAEQCGAHDHEHCQACAEACRKCADECLAMAS